MQKILDGPNYNVEFPTDNSIENFEYNGFSVEAMKGFASYEVESLINWTNDPGIGLFLCSDNKKRLIPCCQLTKDFLSKYKKQERLQCFGKNATGVLFGQPCKS